MAPVASGSSSIPSTKTPTVLRPQKPSSSAQKGAANRIQKSTAIKKDSGLKSNYRLPGRLAQTAAPHHPAGKPHRPLALLQNHLNTSASPSGSTSLPHTSRARIKIENVTSLPSCVTPDQMEGGKAVKTEPGNEVVDLSKTQPSASTLWDTGNPVVRDLIHSRHRLQQISRAATRDGLSLKDAAEVKRILDKLSTFPFEGEAYNETKIVAAVRLVAKPEIYGDVIAGRATALREKWKNGDFSPEPFPSDEDQLEDSSDEEEEYETSASEGERVPSRRDPGTTPSQRERIDECVTRLLRGITIGRGNQGTKIYKLDPRYPKKPADVFGHNGLRVGDWWPFQTFALKDGAHGSKMGGIHGRTNLGAFSVVVSGGIYEDNDRDSGDRILYSGSKGNGEDATSEAPYTNATKSLVVSTRHNQPVRVLRSARNNSRWSPSAGIRYDGLYNVESYAIKTDGEGKKFYQFVLVRCPDQDPIDRSRPTVVEEEALARIRAM